MTSTTILDNIAPELASDSKKAIHIDLATARTSSIKFGDNKNYAIALRAAHTLTIANRNDGDLAGNAESKKEGDLSVSYGGKGSIGSGDLNQTSYGRQLLAIIRSHIPAASVVGNSTI